MARIAGIEAAEATDYMTAALRGFNMELNETSAQRINDVYSKLAAITASNTQEISVAMTKVASLANNANMEFETTAAFLSQIVETTRESAETAGTALKTVIARFSEVKQLYSEGELMGTDEEGMEIDVNKISTALRTAGINLNEYFTGMKGLDEIFLELAQKWDSLTSVQQRYIATQAAGSRQQSRFIAMMSNYDRTIELVNAANNSAGASQEQFNKTLESMETSLAKLKNAWNEFTMGLANNELLKTGIDLLTGLLNAINGITSSISGGNGLIDSVLKIGVAFGALKLGKAAFNKIFSQLTMTSKSEGAKSGNLWIENFKQSLQKSVKLSDSSKIIANNINNGLKNGLKATPNMLANIFSNAGKQSTQQFLKEVPNLQKNITNIFNKTTSALTGTSKDIANNIIKNFNYNFAEKPVESLNTLQNKYVELQKVAESQGIKLPPLDISSAILSINTLQNKITTLGMTTGGAMLALGGAINGISSLLVKVGAISEETGDSIHGVGTAIIGVGAAIMAIMQIIKLTSPLIAGIVVSITALVFLFVHLNNVAKENSLEGRMEAAAKATEAAKESAEAAKQAYDDLLSDKSAYNELQQALGDLIRGTDEWKQKLIEVNQQVLELLTTYPELAQYLGRGSEGQLIIQEEGWDKVIESQQKAVQNTTSAVLASQMDEESLKQEKATQSLQKKFTSKDAYYDSNYGWTGIESGDAISTESQYDIGFVYEQATMDAMLAAFKENPEALFKTEIDENGKIIYPVLDSILDTLEANGQKSDYTAEELWNMKDALIEYVAALEQSQVIVQGQAEGILSARASEDFMNVDKFKYGEDVISAFAKQMTDEDYINDIAARQSEIYQDDKESEAEKDGRFSKLAEEYGVASKMVGDDLKDLRTLYAEMAGIDISKIPEHLKDDKEAMAREIAQMDMSNDIAEKMEKFRINMGKLTDEEQRQFASLLSGEGTRLTYQELEQGQIDPVTLDSYAKRMGYGDAETLATTLGYAGSAELLDFLDESRSNAKAEYDKYLNRWSEDIRNALKGYNLETVKNLSNQMMGMSNEEAKNYVDNFNNVLKSSNLGEEAKKSLESYLSTVDWSNMTQAIEAMDYMQELGIDQSIIESYWNAATEGANTYIHSLEEATKLTEQFQGKISSATEMKERLVEGKGTSKDIAALEEAGVDLTGKLKLTAEGWQMTEEAAEEATKAIYRNTEEQAQAALEAHQNQMEEFNKMRDEIIYYGFNSYGAPTQQQTFAEAIGLTEGVDGKYTAKNFNELYSYTKEWIAQRSDINREDYETDEEYWAAAEGAYNDYIDALNNGEARTEMMQQTADFTAAVAYSADENARRGASDEAVRYAMQNEAVAQGLDSADVTAYSESIRTKYSLDQQTADRIAIDNARLQKGVEDLTSSYDELAIEIEAGIANPKYQTSVNQLKKITENLIGTTEGLSDSWFTNNKQMELFKRIAQGDLKAVDELRKSAAKEIIFGADFDEDSLTGIEKEIADAINNFNPDDLVVGATLEDAGLQEAFDAMIKSGKYTSEQIQGFLDAIGFEPQFETEEYTLSDSDTRKGYIDVPQLDAMGQVTDVTRIPITSSMSAGSTIQIPKIVGKNSDGTGGHAKIIGGKFKGSTTATVSTPPSSGGGGGSTKEWENPYDWLYNLTEKINNKLREREKLERRYTKLIEGRKATAAQLLETSDLELKNLENQSKLQSEMLAKRKQEMEKELSEYSDMSKYASYDFENGLIQIDWDLIDSVTNTEEGERIEEYISKLEEIRDEIQSAEDAMDDIEDQIAEINERGKDEYTSLEEKIKDAIINSRQEEIDRLSAINDAINDTNSKLIDSMQKAIDQQRQDRENEKTEEEIAEKQRRLVYLQQDTSGANALEILQLQDEISEAQESYTDQLIDQKISELQEQNDAAAEQRERQIEILQSQLEYDEKYGVIASQTTQAIKDLIEGGSGGVIVNGTSLAELLMRNEDFAAMTGFAQAEWWADLQTQASLATLYYKQQLATYGNRDFSAEIMEALSKGDYKLAAELEQLRNYKIDLLGLDYEKTYSYATGDWSQWESQSSSEQKPSAPTEPQTPPSSNTPTVSESDKKKVAAAIWRGGLGWGAGAERSNKLNEVFGNGNGIQDMVDRGIGKNDSGDLSEYSYTKMRKKYKGYKTGGLADYTGPAWLDGTPSKPEIILNQKDSQNFIELKDILSSLMGYSSKRKAESNGDNYYDIDINVESIGSDYDIERAAEKIKTMIRDDAMYRNVNAINNMR